MVPASIASGLSRDCLIVTAGKFNILDSSLIVPLSDVTHLALTADIRDESILTEVMKGIEVVFQISRIQSVIKRSIDNPLLDARYVNVMVNNKSTGSCKKSRSPQDCELIFISRNFW